MTQTKFGDFDGGNGQQTLSSSDDSSEESDDSADLTTFEGTAVRHPSSIHTDYPDLEEIPDFVPICAEKADLELAGRVARKTIQEHGHHDPARRAMCDWAREDDTRDKWEEIAFSVGVSEFSMGNIEDSAKASLIIEWAKAEHPERYKQAVEEYNQQIRDRCEKQLEEEEKQQKARQFEENPPSEINGWERFYPTKPDVGVAYRGGVHGTPAVVAVYQTDEGLDAHETTWEWWQVAETAAESQVNRHLVSVTGTETTIWRDVRNHLLTFDAEPLENHELQSEESKESEDSNPDFADFEFSEGDGVVVDWSEGMGSDDRITGIVDDISRSAGEIVVSVVDYTDEDWPNGRHYDCAPEWIEVKAESAEINAPEHWGLSDHCAYCGSPFGGEILESAGPCPGCLPENEAEVKANGGEINDSEDSTESEESGETPDEGDGQELSYDPDEEAVGDEWVDEFLYTSWGYNQTNVDFAQIIEVSESGKTVVARRAPAERVDTGRGTETVRPKGEPYGDEFRLHVRDGIGDKPGFRGSYPYVDGEKEKGTHRETFFHIERDDSVHQTAPGYGH